VVHAFKSIPKACKNQSSIFFQSHIGLLKKKAGPNDPTYSLLFLAAAAGVEPAI